MDARSFIIYLEKVNTYSRTIEGYLTDLQAVFNLLQKGDGNPHLPSRMDVENSQFMFLRKTTGFCGHIIAERR